MTTALLLLAVLLPNGTREPLSPVYQATTEAAPTQSQRELRPRWRPVKAAHTSIAPGEDPTRILFKLVDDLGGRALNGRLAAAPRSVRSEELASVTAIVAKVQGAQIEPLFTLKQDVLLDLRERGQQRSGEELADLSQYFVLRLPRAAPALRILNALNALACVEEARACPERIFPAGDLPPQTSTFSQNYIFFHGFDDVQGVAGGDGTGVAVCDVEGSWNLAGMFGDTQTHEDLMGLDSQTNAPAAWDPTSWLNPFGDTNHGTAVLGILGGDNDQWGIDGVVPGADLHVSAAFTTAGWNTASAILKGGLAVGQGGVVLIELQIGGVNFGTCAPNTQFGSLPMESLAAEYNAIRTLTALGIHVVEAAGNGNQDFDSNNGGAPGTQCVSAGDPSYPPLFDLSVRNSGAVVVGASIDNGNAPNWTTNRGQRVDCYAHGENVTSLGYGDLANLGPDQLYTSTFAGTSSASAIVAGIVTVLEGTHEALYGTEYPPHALRMLVRTSGWTTLNPTVDRIGRFTDLDLAYDILTTGPGPALIYDGPFGGARAGRGAAGAGDVNGDGYGDIVVAGEMAQAVVLSGVTGDALHTFTDASNSFGRAAVAGAGDVNNDGFDDVIVGRGTSGSDQAAFVYSGQDGSTLYTFAGTGDGTGQAVDGLGDVDGDGYDDVLVSAPYYPGTGGRVYVYSGQTGNALHTIDGELSFPVFGYDVAGAGDANGDGTPDFVVSSSHHLQSATQRKVYVYSGASGSLLWSVTGDGWAAFGKDVNAAGDIDNDGYDDVLVGAPKDDTLGIDRGRAYVYSGLSGNLLLTVDSPNPSGTSHDFGYSVAPIGDVNKNGNVDFVVGAPGVGVGGWRVGGVWILDGSDGSIIEHYEGEFPSNGAATTAYGYMVDAGDIDGNGTLDLIVGSPDAANFSLQGRVYTYLTPAVVPQNAGSPSASTGSINAVNPNRVIVAR